MDENGQGVVIEDDVSSIARQIREISPRLQLHWRPKGEVFAVVEREDLPDGSVRVRLVTTARELDPRLVERVRRIAAEDYDFVKEVEAHDARVDREAEHRFHERTGEAGEHAYHAIRKDLGIKTRAFVPKDVA